jgi:hypothetical protein
MGDPTSSYAAAGIALKVSGALKPHHHDKVETPSVGNDTNYIGNISTDTSTAYKHNSANQVSSYVHLKLAQ